MFDFCPYFSVMPSVIKNPLAQEPWDLNFRPSSAPNREVGKLLWTSDSSSEKLLVTLIP